MTVATEKGFEIGKCYRVKNNVVEGYYQEGMIVKFIEDDASTAPLFEIMQGRGEIQMPDNEIYVKLDYLERPSIEDASDKSKAILMSLQIYIKQQYPDDIVLNTLANAL